MTQQKSFTKVENELKPQFRQRISHAESTEDVKKFFVYTVHELLGRAVDGEMQLEAQDLVLDPGKAPHYAVSPRLSGTAAFEAVWAASDLPHVIGRLAESAMHRYTHLEKHPEKTKSKIRGSSGDR